MKNLYVRRGVLAELVFHPPPMKENNPEMKTAVWNICVSSTCS